MEQSDELTPMCVDIPGLLGSVVETPAAARTLKNFMRIVEKRLAAMTGTDKSPDHV
jgi:hypothetical protein